MLERIAALLGRIERDSLLASGVAQRSVVAFHALIDTGFVVLAAWRSNLPSGGTMPWGAAAFAPLLLVLATRLLPVALPRRRWSHWLEDRMLIGTGLALTSLALPFDLTIGVAVVGLIGACLVTLQLSKRQGASGLNEAASPNPQLTSRH